LRKSAEAGCELCWLIQNCDLEKAFRGPDFVESLPLQFYISILSTRQSDQTRIDTINPRPRQDQFIDKGGSRMVVYYASDNGTRNLRGQRSRATVTIPLLDPSLLFRKDVAIFGLCIKRGEADLSRSIYFILDLLT
jgi:hypothetical protein